MITMSRRSLLLGASALLAAAGPLARAAADAPARRSVPSDSIYQLAIPLTDQAGATFQLAERRGTPMIVSMFYTSCQFVCPMLIDAIEATETKLTPAERQRLKITLVSFDPEHDTVAVLRQKADERHLDAGRWTMARTDATSVRKLAALLGIQYRAIGNGDFNHSTALIAVDGEGRVVGKTAELAGADPEFVKRLKKTLASA
jgi:protein SCO1/2